MEGEDNDDEMGDEDDNDEVVDDETINEDDDNDKVEQKQWYYKAVYIELGQQILTSSLRSSWFCY